MTDSSSKTFSTCRSHYINYLFGVLFFIAPAILVFCYFVSHRDEFEGVAYSKSIPIIKEIDQYKECVYGRTSEEKAFKNPDLLED